MNRFLALLLALVMLLALTACDTGDEGTPAGESTGASTNATQSTGTTINSTPSSTPGTTDDTTESTTGGDNTGNDNTTSTSKPTETPSTENCDHSYTTDGMTDCMGILTYVCSKCQHSYGVETGKYWHEFKIYYAKQPTLTEDGVLCQECTKCQLKETESTGKLLPNQCMYIGKLHCFLESDSPLNTELYTLEGKAKAILYNRYPDEITEEELFTKWRCWEFNISNDEIQEMKTTSHYNASKKVFLSFYEGTHPPVLTSYLGYTDNGDGTVTAYASILVRIVTGATGDYVESGYCKVQMKYATPSTNEQIATFHITSIMRVESIPANLT
ncbi:MAG: hypothetical protein E7455_09145 [Ruminococcaceae bacterium]|nr:hypothetical protein [Oscillospiraceae bacterium]